MKTVILLLMSTGALIWAQDRPAESVKKLDSVTWDLSTHKLIWVVQTGTEVNGEFVAKDSTRYEVSPDEASMALKNEKRGFTQEEAASLHHLLDVLSLYCAESTEWWEQGGGTPVPTGVEQKSTGKSKAPDGKAVRVTEPQTEKPKPSRPVLDGLLVAINRVH